MAKNKLMWDYGLTLEQYHRMFEKQEDRCGICKRHQSEFKKRLFVDHCHETGKVRGLLCFKCNNLLGQANDDPSILQNAIEYLKEHNLGSEELISKPTW